MKPIKLKWQKASYRRYWANVGPLTIEVRLCGIQPNKYWIVGEVFGQHHHHGSRGEYETPEDAQIAAEQVAWRLLRQAWRATALLE